jgi:molybdopterin synthase catalytic subunit
MSMPFLTTAPLELGALLAQVNSPGHGGIAAFLGTVRDHHGGREVVRLEYSAYAPMAEAECARIIAEAQSRWPVAVALQHRVGRLEIGDPAVAIVVGSAHRDEAFTACRYMIEELKRRVPIWKKEYFVDGTVEWAGGSGAAGQGGSGAVDEAVGASSAQGGSDRSDVLSSASGTPDS